MDATDAAIAHAVQQARYNELVHITLNEEYINDDDEDDDDEKVSGGNSHGDDGDHPELESTACRRRRRHVCLVPCLDEEHGGTVFHDLVTLVRSSRRRRRRHHSAPTAATTTRTTTTNTTTTNNNNQNHPQQTTTTTTSNDNPDETDNDDSNENDDDTTDMMIVAARELQTKQWFFPMLNDHRRNELYAMAIERAIGDAVAVGVATSRGRGRRHAAAAVVATTDPQRSNETNREHDTALVVLDIGTGTGLLSLLAARYLQQQQHQKEYGNDDDVDDTVVQGQGGHCHRIVSSMIVAMEMSQAMSHIAAQTIHDNNQHPKKNSMKNPSIVLLSNQHSMELMALPQCNNHNDNNTSKVDPTTTKTNATVTKTKPNMAHVCVSELLDHGLLGEGWLPTLRDAWDRQLLSSDCCVIPKRAKVYARLVSGSWLNQYMTPISSSSSSSIHSFPWHCCLDPTTNDVAPRHVCLPIHAAHLIQQGLLRFRSDPLDVFEFDVSNGGGHIPSPRGRQRIVSTVVVDVECGSNQSSSGINPVTSSPCATTPSATTNNNTITTESSDTVDLQGVLVWWDLELYDNIWYSTEPGKGPWQDHWCPCLHVFRRPLSVSKGDTVSLVVSHTDTCITIDACDENDSNQANPEDDGDEDADDTVTRSDKKRLKDNPRQPLTSTHVNHQFSPERIVQLNDVTRWSVFHDATHCVYSDWQRSSTSGSTFVFLDVSDGAVGAWIASQTCDSSVSRILSLESSSSGVPAMSMRMASAALSSSQNDATAGRQCEIELVHCYTEQLTGELLTGDDSRECCIDVVWAEPYYQILEGWHLQEALNFFYIIRLLRSRQLLSKQVRVLPSNCRVMGCIIQSDQLNSSYRACGEKSGIMGVDHSYVNALGDRFDMFDLSLPMWQYDYTALSEKMELSVLDYDASDTQPNKETLAHGLIHTAGRCDALMVWLEYSFPKEGPGHSMVSHNKQNVLSTLDRSHRQAIRMFDVAARREITQHELGRAMIHCSSRFGSLSGPDDHNFDVKIDVPTLLN